MVEDDLALASLETDILTARGYVVTSVPSGELAIATLRHMLPDIVVLDLELTGHICGWDVLHELREHSAHNNIPVLITSSSVTTVRRYVRNSGETRNTLDHLAKPYALQTLIERIQHMLSINPS
jgi:DNA-binding response OmpR family regulator